MSLSAAIIRELVAAGLSGDGLVAACERIERACPPESPVEIPVDKTAEKRRAYDRERKRVHRNSTGIPPDSGGMSQNALSIEEDTIRKVRKKESKRESRATRIPPDWKPDAEFARRQGLSDRDFEVETEKFRNYWSAKSGKDAAKLDWAATWRNWILRVCEQRGIAPIVSAENPEDASRGWRSGLPTSAELEAKYGGSEGTRGQLDGGPPVAQEGLRLRCEEQGMVRGQRRIEGARRLGEVLPKLGLHPENVSRAGGRQQMDGALPMARMADD